MKFFEVLSLFLFVRVNSLAFDCGNKASGNINKQMVVTYLTLLVSTSLSYLLYQYYGVLGVAYAYILTSSFGLLTSAAVHFLNFGSYGKPKIKGLTTFIAYVIFGLVYVNFLNLFPLVSEIIFFLVSGLIMVIHIVLLYKKLIFDKV